VNDDDTPVCQTSGGGTRTRANCKAEPKPTTVRTEATVKLPSIDEPAPPTARCEAVTTTEYQQRNTIARVNSTLAIKSCAAAAGSFTFLVRVRDASGEIKPLEFSEMWQRSDDHDIKFIADYPIGEDVELVTVRVRDLRCTCADSPSEKPGQ
jgi:hypothetical protein